MVGMTLIIGVLGIMTLGTMVGTDLAGASAGVGAGEAGTTLGIILGDQVGMTLGDLAGIILGDLAGIALGDLVGIVLGDLVE